MRDEVPPEHRAGTGNIGNTDAGSTPGGLASAHDTALPPEPFGSRPRVAAEADIRPATRLRSNSPTAPARATTPDPGGDHGE